MSKEEKGLIYVLLVIIIICSLILFIKIKNGPKYNKKLYDEIYNDYDALFLENNNLENNIDIGISETNQIGTSNENNQNNNIKSKITNQSNTQNTNNEAYMTSTEDGNKYKIIGKISIPKIQIYYPIIFETTDEYLKIAPTKYCGPNINEVGNLCIMGHNYYNDQFFSRLSELNNDDRVILTSNQGKSETYFVYDKYKINKDDLSCTSQETNGKIELTLVTCVKYDKSKRLVVKCRVYN